MCAPPLHFLPPFPLTFTKQYKKHVGLTSNVLFLYSFKNA